MKTIKSIIAFFVSIWVFLFGKKAVKTVNAAPPKKTLEERMEEAGPKPKYRPKRIVPQHNNRKNTRGRYVQFTPSGRAIYHDVMRKK
jgi:hypothetical protein